MDGAFAADSLGAPHDTRGEHNASGLCLDSIIRIPMFQPKKTRESKFMPLDPASHIAGSGFATPAQTGTGGVGLATFQTEIKADTTDHIYGDKPHRPLPVLLNSSLEAEDARSRGLVSGRIDPGPAGRVCCPDAKEPCARPQGQGVAETGLGEGCAFCRACAVHFSERNSAVCAVQTKKWGFGCFSENAPDDVIAAWCKHAKQSKQARQCKLSQHARATMFTLCWQERRTDRHFTSILLLHPLSTPMLPSLSL